MKKIVLVLIFLMGMIGVGEVRGVDSGIGFSSGSECKACGCECKYVETEESCITQYCEDVVCEEVEGECLNVGIELECEQNTKMMEGECTCVEPGGDYDDNGYFEVADLIGWYGSYRGSYVEEADFDCNGTIDVQDLIVWYGSYRNGVESPTPTNTSITPINTPVSTSTPVPTDTPVPTSTSTPPVDVYVRFDISPRDVNDGEAYRFTMLVSNKLATETQGSIGVKIYRNDVEIINYTYDTPLKGIGEQGSNFTLIKSDTKNYSETDDNRYVYRAEISLNGDVDESDNVASDSVLVHGPDDPVATPTLAAP